MRHTCKAMRILANVEYNHTTGCLEWIGKCKLPNGHIAGFGTTLHRLMYDPFRRLHSDEFVHHTCGNQLCLNVHHLQAMSSRKHGEHHNPKATHCVHGHELTPDNLVWKNENGRKRLVCAACRHEQQKKWRDAHPDYQREHRTVAKIFS